MRVAVTGAGGLIGSALCRALVQGGHDLLRLVRRPVRADDEIAWDPEHGTIERERLRSCDAVVHLAGENIAQGRWTSRKKERIRASRVVSTRLLAETVAHLPDGPRVLVNASAIGYYGDRGDERLDESSTPGDDFLARVCHAWEAATSVAQANGIRVVRLRIGVVLSPDGGALAAMRRPFSLGLGGRVGSGRQYWSWIAIDDLVRIIARCLEQEDWEGPINAVAPHPVTNAEFTRALARTLRRPACLPLPAWVVRRLMGEMGRALLLASTRVVPARLAAAGFSFEFPELDAALATLLARSTRPVR